MGCCCTPCMPAVPSSASIEEKAISICELSLGYHKHSANRVTTTVMRYEEDGKVTGNQFNTIASELGLNVEDMDSLDEGMGVFYGHLKDKGKFDSLKLSVLAVLLAQSDDKSNELFACAARKNKTELSPSDVNALFEAMFYVSAEALPLLAKGVEGETNPGLLSPATVTDYISKLKSGKEPLHLRLSSTLIRGRSSVTQSQFVEEFHENEDLKSLQRPYDVRMSLLKFAPEVTVRGPSAAMQPFGPGFLSANR